MLQIMNCETVRQMWDKLHIIYEQESTMFLPLLQQKLLALQFEKGDDVATFVAQDKDIVSRLKQLNSKVPTKMIITKVLITLPEEYRHFMSPWQSVPEDRQAMSELTMHY